MGTNYNLISTDKAWIIKYFGEGYAEEWTLVDVPYFGYEVHLGKRSSGWKPLFQTHNRAYRSVKEMLEFLRREKGKYRLYDEFGRELSIEELIAELVDWGDKQKQGRFKYTEGMLMEDPEGELITPIDHMKYSKLDLRNRGRRIRYWQDKEGYDFRDGYFC